MKDKRIFILMGGSGAGKTRLGIYLREIGVPEMVSHTTRPIRNGEIPGVTYYYINRDEFENIDKIEQTEYPKDSGIFYCLSSKEVESKLDKYDTVFAITDKNGVDQIKAQYREETKVIYVHAPVEILEKRMRLRGDSELEIQKRLKQVEDMKELENHQFADYIIENLDWEESKRKIKEIIMDR